MEESKLTTGNARQERGYRGEDGWTFIETLVVLGIVLILTATVGFMAARYLGKAREVAAKSQIETFSLAIQSYYLDCGSFPTEDQGLDALWQKPTLSPVPSAWTGPYLMKKTPLDPWGNPYVYEVPGPNGLPFSIASYGADGSPGGEGADADLFSY
ncbi:MAG: type II secretion system major pseudopilin GspG [Spirochaetales bacterium]|nr:type II secretion system major pseudopilin GspG [Spirochaetales bacterium]